MNSLPLMNQYPVHGQTFASVIEFEILSSLDKENLRVLLQYFSQPEGLES